jgi:ribosomal protein S25
MRDGYEIFKNTYINYKQRQIEAVINMIGSYRGVKEPMYLIAVEPIGIEFGEQTIAAVAPKEWILEKLGIDMSQYQTQPQQMSDEFIFEEFGEAASNFQVFKKKARFDEYTDYELFATINQVKADILDLISKDKRITPEVIADTLKIDIDVVNRNIEDLIKSGSLAQGTENGVLIHELTAPLKDLTKIEPETKSFMIRYSYEWKDIVPAGERNTAAHPSREFCKRLMSLDKFYSRSDIEQISARLGYSVWDRKGGWWTMPSGEHSPSCRHEWKSNIVMRKNK